MREIEDWRRKIDQTDDKLLELLNRRTQFTSAIGELKREHDVALYDPERENTIFERLASINQGPLSSDAVQRIFERIIDESRHAQKLIMDRNAETQKSRQPKEKKS